jgi:hypothetical protein
MLGPDLPQPLAGGLLDTPHTTPKTDKRTVVNLYLWMGARAVEQ